MSLARHHGFGDRRGPPEAQLNTYLSDTFAEALGRGVRQTLEEVADRASKTADPKKLLEYAPHLKSTGDLNELADCDLVIEAVIRKRSTSSSSCLPSWSRFSGPMRFWPPTPRRFQSPRLAKGLKHPERFCGIHYFNPVRRMMLVEVIRGPQTSDATVASAVAHVKKLGKYPVVVEDGPGFLVNRLLFPYMNEALLLLGEGVPMEAIDRAAKKFGLPMGPLELYDMVGMDTALYAGSVMQAALPERMVETPILGAMVQAGRLGNKSGLGFYSYKNRKGKRTADPQVQELLKPYVSGQAPDISPDQLATRLILPMLLEATDVLAAAVRDARDVDLGLIYGIGFPPFRAGCCWADRQGIDKIMGMLEPLIPLGPRFKPPSY